MKYMNRKGFSLIELLVVIGIIASIVALAIPNYLGARQRAQDSKKKQEMNQLKNALRLYYNDYASYPADAAPGPLYVQLKGCGASGTEACPCVSGSTSIDFAAGGAGCDVVYMKQFPTGFGPNAPSKTIFYYRTSNGDDFCLRAVLDNASDPDIATSQSRCVTACGASCTGSGRYCVCAD
jgi:prepilin-type N-terminal cleavage/methylation domain-containing protein